MIFISGIIILGDTISGAVSRAVQLDSSQVSEARVDISHRGAFHLSHPLGVPVLDEMRNCFSESDLASFEVLNRLKETFHCFNSIAHLKQDLLLFCVPLFRYLLLNLACISS